MDELQEKVLHLLRDNLIAVGFGFIGLVLLLYGLIAYGTVSASTDNATFTSEDNIGDQKPNAEKPVTIVVDVAGAVEKPGVYNVPEDARFQDAIMKAGGMSSEADQDLIAKQINLAAKLTDGAKVYVPFKGEQ